MIEIRVEQPKDYAAIRELIVTVFYETYGSGEEEARLVEDLRAMEGYDPSLSLVAVDDGLVIGHVMFSPVTILSPRGPVPAVCLAPLGVAKPYRGQGIGSLLARTGLERARELGYRIAFVQGDPCYYGRFGFEMASARGLISPFAGAPDPANMVLELVEGGLQGVSGPVDYPAPWDPFK
jgi:putative acetyltransferase